MAWRGDSLNAVINEYRRFGALAYLPKVTIIYDTMYGSTCRVAVAMAEGVKAAGARVDLLNLGSNDLTKVALHLYDSAGFALGSPTLNATMMPTVE